MTRPLTPEARDRAAGALGLAHRMAWKFARHLARDVPADELTAEALYALCYAASLYDPARETPFGAYATMVIRHRLAQMVQVWRRDRRVVGRLPGADRQGEDAWDAADPAAPDPGAAAEAAEGCARVRAALRPREFAFLYAYHAEGRTLDDLGRVAGVTRQRVREIVLRARDRARAARA